jgi:hypothetical protein
VLRFIEELDGGGRKKMLIKDCEYWEDKLSMGHMALSYIVQYDDSEKNHIVFKLGRQQESD